jgi:hypothetical protein
VDFCVAERDFVPLPAMRTRQGKRVRGIERNQHLARGRIIARDVTATRWQVSFFFRQSVIACTVCQSGLPQMDHSFDSTDGAAGPGHERLDGRHDKGSAILASLTVGWGSGKEKSEHQWKSDCVMAIKKGNKRNGECMIGIKKEND